MDVRAVGPLHSAEEITPAWLQHVLGSPAISELTAERIGTGQMSESHRVTVAYDDPADGFAPTYVVKLASADEQSRATGLALGIYEREVRFYAEVAPRVGGPLPACHHASFDPATGAFCLVLDDAGPAVQGDEVAGATHAQARLAVAELGRLHAAALAVPPPDWLDRPSPITQPILQQLLAGFRARYAGHVAPEHLAVAERLAASFDAYLDQETARTDVPDGLVHGDYRLDNLLFGDDGTLTVVDWQTVTWGPAVSDLAYFLGGSLSVADRRAWEDELLAVYGEALGALTPEQVREGVRRQAFFGVVMAVVSPLMVVQTERGDAMFMAMFARHCQSVLDRDALAVLPPPAADAPLAPDPVDEAAHPAGDEPLWNESWYFDVADPEQGIGGYHRLGVDPASGTSWLTTIVCGPGRPTIALVDFAAPLPADDDRVEQSCEAPLERFRITVRGTAQRFDDPAALLRGERGEPVDLELDLVWATASTPYRYRLTTRYELACTVSGTIRAGEDVYELRGARGQRDHSWGVRDWWSMGWVWSAVHLDDGTRLHATHLRIPGMDAMGMGYVQPPGAALAELTRVDADATFADDGLGGPTTLTYDDVVCELTPIGHGPLRLEAADGRVARFPRAWGPVMTRDGRTGVGWIEWNLDAVR